LYDDERLLGTRIILEKGVAGRLPYADNIIDLVIIRDLTKDKLRDTSLKEILRVLRPGGKALLGHSVTLGQDAQPLTGKQLETWLRRESIESYSVEENDLGLWVEFSKPVPIGIDAWSHWYHEPDNNPVSTDAIIKAPYLTQWTGKPFHVAMPVVTTAAGGRVFTATGTFAQHRREYPTIYKLYARNGYNGTILWERKLAEGYLVHGSVFIATSNTFYMIDGDRCLLLDPETGDEKGDIRVPEVEGLWRWIAIKDGILFVLAGAKHPATQASRGKSEYTHWSWRGVVTTGKHGMYKDKPTPPWISAATLAAYDIKQKKTLWVHKESRPIDSRAVGICDNRLFCYVPELRIVCLDLMSGKLIWSNTEPKVLNLIEERFQSLGGFLGLRIILCTDRFLFFAGKRRANIVAVSAENGRLLWTKRRTSWSQNMLFINDKLVISDAGEPHEKRYAAMLDPTTGDELEKLDFSKISCARLTASTDSLFVRGPGVGRYDLVKHIRTIDFSNRPGCTDGVVPANGLLYVCPWMCDCNLLLSGTVALCSANGFRITELDDAKKRVERGTPGIQDVKKPDVNGLDWPTYRANNRRSAGSKAIVPHSVLKLWEYEPKIRNRTSSATAVEKLVFVCGSDGKVRCLDGNTGKLHWDFATAGPVRLPPTIWDGRAFVGSGDGYVYCLEAVTGRLLWRFRAAPQERRIMVYGALCSTWPVNSGVLIEDGVAYAAAGIVNRDGTFVYALDAREGKLKWQNARPAWASAQGDLTVNRGLLWMASGNMRARTAYDLKTGQWQSTHKYTIETGRLQPEQGSNTSESVVGEIDESRCIAHGGKIVCSLDENAAPRQFTLLKTEDNKEFQEKIMPHSSTFNAGCEIGVFRDRYIIHGGRTMYSEEGAIVRPGQFTLLELGDDRGATSLELLPFRRSKLMPAWDEDLFVCLADRYYQLMCWDTADLETALNTISKGLHEYLKRGKKYFGSETTGRFRSIAMKAAKWKLEGVRVLGIAIADNAVLAICETKEKNQWELRALSREDGKVLWQQDLAGEPVMGGLCIDRNGNVIIAMRNGRVICLGREN